jgi:ADP-heptose:LPS heptosyltransferase
MALVDLAPELGDFSDTAAAIANLDLVITVDTAVAHLAGAMAKPVWTLAALPLDWRWAGDGRCAWYPTMKVFRQARHGDWDGVLREVAAALAGWR